MAALVAITAGILSKRWSVGLLIGYVLIILGETVMFRTPTDRIHFQPQLFWSYEVWDIQKEQILANVLAYIPLGLIAGKLWRGKGLIAGIGLSVTSELLQLITHRGLFEFDDIIHNTLGTLIGVSLIIVIEKAIRRALIMDYKNDPRFEGIEPLENRVACNQNYLSKNNTNALKGIMAMLVFICHLPSYLHLFSGSIVGSFLSCMGSPCVGVFFFLSGYGLMTQYNQRPGYLQYFWKHRILPYAINYLIVLVMYVSINLIVGNQLDITLLLRSFILGGYVLNGWYLQIQFWLYVVFYFTFRLKTNNIKKIILLMIIVISYYVLGALIKLQGTYYITVVLFVFGLVWAEYKYVIHGRLNDVKKCLLYGVLMFGFGMSLIVIRRALSVNRSVITTISDIMICMGLLLIIRCIRISYKTTNWLGKYSYEIYVLQGLSFILFKQVLDFGAYLNCIISLVITLILSVVLHPLFCSINNRFKVDSDDLLEKKFVK